MNRHTIIFVNTLQNMWETAHSLPIPSQWCLYHTVPLFFQHSLSCDRWYSPIWHSLEARCYSRRYGRSEMRKESETEWNRCRSPLVRSDLAPFGECRFSSPLYTWIAPSDPIGAMWGFPSFCYKRHGEYFYLIAGETPHQNARSEVLYLNPGESPHQCPNRPTKWWANRLHARWKGTNGLM